LVGSDELVSGRISRIPDAISHFVRLDRSRTSALRSASDRFGFNRRQFARFTCRRFDAFVGASVITGKCTLATQLDAKRSQLVAANFRLVAIVASRAVYFGRDRPTMVVRITSIDLQSIESDVHAINDVSESVGVERFSNTAESDAGQSG
jgi:hypothetical protein